MIIPLKQTTAEEWFKNATPASLSATSTDQELQSLVMSETLEAISQDKLVHDLLKYLKKHRKILQHIDL